MNVFERYFERNRIEYCPEFPNRPEVIVIIPVLDDRDIFTTLASLRQCRCRRGPMGVLVVVNHGENAEPSVKRANRLLMDELRRRALVGQSEHSTVYVELMEAFDLPAKQAGVGLARKIAMDAVASYFYRQGMPDAPILSLDADTWVEENYPDEVGRFFAENAVAGVSIAYAHRLEECPDEAVEAMVKYELYLRYYQQALAYTGHPHAFHCIGSAFAVRAVDYVAQGGMNKRQAGEDFYFLQKLILTGRYATLKTTRVYPSARFSFRTPFGTGQSVRQIVEANGAYPVYCFEAFRQLKSFFSGLEGLYKADAGVCEKYFERQSEGVRRFLKVADGMGMVTEANANCASLPQFIRRFFDHFNAFRVLKYLNFVHDEQFRKVDITVAVEELFRELGYSHTRKSRDNLSFLRSL